MKIAALVIVHFFCVSSVLGQGADTRAREYEERERESRSLFARSKKISLMSPVPDIGHRDMIGSLAFDQMQSGQVGKLAYWQFNVETVIDELNVILICGTKSRIWLEGYPTIDLTDGQTVFVVDYVEVQGTKSYQTVLGTKSTIRHVRLLPAEETAKRIKEDLSRQLAESPEIGFRMWKLKNKKSIEGTFIDLVKTKVQLKKRDGKQTTIAFSDLSDVDKAIVKNLQAAKSAKVVQNIPAISQGKDASGRPTPPAKHVEREWQSKDTKSKIKAVLIESDFTTATLKKSDGKVIKVNKDKLADADRTYIEKAFVDAEEYRKTVTDPPSTRVMEASAMDESRRVWNSTSYGTIIAYKDERIWTDTDVVTGKLKFEMEYRGQTPEYVELFNPARNDLIRLHKDHMEVKQEKGWVSIGAGHWKSHTSQAKPDKGVVGQLSAEVLDVKIVPERNDAGQEFRIVKVTWKNTGNKNIRVIDADISVVDNTGGLPPKLNYTIFACSNEETGIKPGETYAPKEWGFALPLGCTATEAKVEITEILEKSSF